MATPPRSVHRHLILAASTLVLLLAGPGGRLAAAAHPSRVDAASLPLLFEANRGQADSSVAFRARSLDAALELAGAEIRVAVAAGPPAAAPRLLRLRLRGASPDVTLVGRRPIAAGTSYFLGSEPGRWIVAIPTYEEVLAAAAVPGVDVVYRGRGGRLEFDLVLQPGTDPAAVALEVGGADALVLEPGGDLVAHVADRRVRLALPAVYQEQDGERCAVSGAFVLRGPAEVGFEVGAYDPGRTLVIDPVIQYATPIGGTDTDNGLAVAVSASGELVVAGSTESTNFPTSGGAVQPSFGGAGQYGGDAFAAKLTAAGTSFQWVTYVGGSLEDNATAVAVDTQGNVVIAGDTESNNYPVAAAYQPSRAGGTDAFVTKIAANGASLVYSTYLGGGENDVAYGLTLDGGGSACVTGSTFSTDFPVLKAFQPSFGGRIFDAFVTKLAANGASLQYSSYLGGSSYDIGYAIAADSVGNLFVAGTTFSTNFPVKGAFQATAGGGTCSGGTFTSNCSDAFVSKVDPSASGAASLVYSTYLAGTAIDHASGIAVDGAGQAVVVGSTTSTNFPTANAVQASRAGGYDAFVAKLNTAGSGLVSATYLGGTGFDEASEVALSAGGATAVGLTGSTGYPTAAPIQATHGGGESMFVAKIVAATSSSIGLSLVSVSAADAFVSRIDASGSPLTFSSFVGGSKNDYANGVASDSAGHLYLTGNTASANFPFASPAQPALGGDTDAWAAKITMGPVVTADVAITKTDTPDPVTVGNQLTYTLSVVNHGPDEAASTRVVDTVPAALNGVSASSTRGSCSVAGNAVTCDLGSLAKNASALVTVHADAATGGMVTNTASVSSSAVDPTPANNSSQAATTIAGLPGSLAVTIGASATTGVAPLPVAFSASASGGTPPYTYDWNFGDGSPHASGATPSHTFTTAGSFTVTVTVTDAVAATATATASISVSFPASPYQYLVPGIAHAPGAGGTQWRSAVAAVNRTGASATLVLTYFSESPTRYATATLASGAAVEWTNVLEEVFGFAASSQTSGSLLVGSSAPLHITARTFNQTPSGTFGQYLPALTAADAIPGGATGVLPQLRKNAAFRTNVGGVNLGTAACTVEVRLFGSTGVQVGSTKSLAIDPQRWKQQFDIFADVNAGDQDIAYAKVTVQPAGAQAWVYASVVDAATGDPTTIPVLVAGTAGAAAPAEAAPADPLVTELIRRTGAQVQLVPEPTPVAAAAPADGLVFERVRRTRPGPRSTLPARAQETTAVVFQDGFEGAFPGTTWSLYDNGPVGWGTSTYRVSEGVQSVWCVGGGVNPPPPGGRYPAGLETWMVAGPFSLADASAAQVLFDLWLDSELKYDYVYWLVSLDDTDYTGVRTSGNTGGWQAVKFDLADIDDPVFIGQPQVYFALVFASDSTTQAEGAYIDALRFEKTVAGPACTVACDATVPAAATTGQAVSFAATATASGCSGALAYDWNFGDGSPHGSGAAASHAYATAGTFTWTLTVTADATPCTRSGTVTVTQPTSYLYVVPAVAHNAGLAGSQWRTDVAAVNLATTGADVDLTYYASPAVTAERTLPAGHTAEWRNLVESVFGIAAAAESKGTLHVSSSVPLFLTARTYNQGSTGTFGQYLPALTAAQAIPAGTTGVLPQLKSTTAYRTNLGFVNLGSTSCSVAVKLYDENGAQVGSMRTFAVDAGRWFQQSDIFGHAGAGSQDVAYATVEVQTPGGTVWAYASVADNVTSDPTTIPVLVH